MSTIAQNAKAIFLEAVEEHSPDQWPAFLDEKCGEDRDLRQRVEGLLQAHQDQDCLFDRPDPTQDAFADAVGKTIGQYKLLQKIGEGGFGAVFMAEQEEPVLRRVALKIIKPGMDSREVVARFEAERQALAMMNHPYIAQVFDGGVTDGGRPYFVMELVKGVPITEYCDKNDLRTESRLQLFTDICQAVQHAHQKGVIHRDLKPSNVMVTLHDGKPVVKIIDFGVSKAINQRLTERTLFTAYGQMVGTPQYMSPEQAEMSGLDVDTRSDIYSLGVLLYELLTGFTPLDAERLRDAGYAEIQRIIQQENPPKPSVRLSSLGERLTVIAKHRSVDPRRLRQLVHGELDWIVMKALEKDRDRRYGSASAFAKDVDCFLNGETVQACPPSKSYLFRKFARRNRVAIGVSLTLCIALVIACVGMGWGMLSAWSKLAVVAEHDHARKSFVLESAILMLQANHPKPADELLESAMSELDDSAFHDQCRALRSKCDVSLQAPVLSTLTPLCIAISPTEDLIAFGTAAFMVDVQRLPDGEQVHRLRRPKGWVRTVRFSPDGQIVAAGSSDPHVRLWDVRSGAQLHTLEGDTKARSIAFSPDGKLIATGDNNGQVRLWNVNDGKLIARLVEIPEERPERPADAVNSTEPYSIWNIEFSPDGSAIAAGDYRMTTVWNVEDRSQRFKKTGFHRGDWEPRDRDCSPVSHFTFSPDGAHLACWRLGERQQMILLDVETGSEKFFFAESENVHLAEFSSDGQFLVGSCPEQAVKIWATETGDLVNTLRSPNGSKMYGIAISPDNNVIATGGDDNVVRLWDPHTGKELDQLYGHSDPVGCLLFSHDGQYLVSWVATSNARVWNLRE